MSTLPEIQPAAARQALNQSFSDGHFPGLAQSWQFADRIGRRLAIQEDCGVHSAEVWRERVLLLLQHLRLRPFPRVYQLADACGATAQQVVTLLAALYADREAAEFLEEAGADAPYRRNTIQPIVALGAVDAFLRGAYRYPFTVGIYPGVTCMLSCRFCGRVPGKSYAREDLALGNQLLRSVFLEAPRDMPRRFYLSGGLEPLTNPGLGQLIAFAASLGHRMQLYTNGMMLTPHLLAAQEGLWDLDALRISLHGADDETAQQTTRVFGTATRVLQNAKDFLRLKAERNSPVRLGFNFVVQSGQVGHLRKIAHAIVRVADASPSRQGIDFLTLRENYAATPSAAIHGAERQWLRDELAFLLQFFKSEGLGAMTVDLGYGLQGLLAGRESAPVLQVPTAALFGQGYPQISVVVDLLGDVYLYREAAFLGREGASRYVVGRITPELGLADILRNYLRDGTPATIPQPGDELFLDAFDHAVTAFLRQSQDLQVEAQEFGIALPRALSTSLPKRAEVFS